MVRTVVVVGGTSGLGLFTARCLAAEGATVVVTGRDLSRLTTEDAAAGIRGVPLDLGSLASARGWVRDFAALGLPDPDVVILNAGQQDITARRWTSDGFEATMAVNFLAPLALLDELAPRLSPSTRVLWTASGTHNPEEVKFAGVLEDASLEELVHPVGRFTRRDGFRWYATSKLCVVRVVPTLASRLLPRQVRVNAFDPGLMPGTGLARGYPSALQHAWRLLAPVLLLAPGAHRPATSARNLSALALDPRFARMSGAYLTDRHPSGSSVASYDGEAADRLLADALELICARNL